MPETMTFKVFRPATGEQFNVEAEYDGSFEDAGEFVINGISFVSNLKMSSTGVGDHSEFTVGIYPNPASEMLNIQFTDFTTAGVEMYSSQGQKVYSGEVTGSPAQINISALPNGIYFLKIFDNLTGSHKTLTFIKR